MIVWGLGFGEDAFFNVDRRDGNPAEADIIPRMLMEGEDGYPNFYLRPKRDRRAWWNLIYEKVTRMEIEAR